MAKLISHSFIRLIHVCLTRGTFRRSWTFSRYLHAIIIARQAHTYYTHHREAYNSRLSQASTHGPEAAEKQGEDVEAADEDAEPAKQISNTQR